MFKYKIIKNKNLMNDTILYDLIHVLRKLKNIKNPNNETYGISCEFAICEYCKIENVISKKRINDEFVRMFTEYIEVHDENDDNIFKFKYIYKHLGSDNKSIDFLTFNNETVSIKTNINGSKICPQNIGQSSRKKWCNYFKLAATICDSDIKEHIISNIREILDSYYNNLFCCDITIYWNKKTPNKFNIINKNSISKINFLSTDIKFSHIINKKLWIESTTIKISNKSIGEFQLHNKRNCIKFRFHLTNLLTLL